MGLIHAARAAIRKVSMTRKLRSEMAADPERKIPYWTELPLNEELPGMSMDEEGAGCHNREVFDLQYELGEELGHGAFGVVYRATCRNFGDVVAVKIMKHKLGDLKSPAVHQLHEEVRVLRSLDHPNVLNLFGVYWGHGELLLVQDFMGGGELFEWVGARGRPITAEEERRLVDELLQGLEYLHHHGIIHRDIKPANLLMASAADDAAMVICDFGLCARLQKEKSSVNNTLHSGGSKAVGGSSGDAVGGSGDAVGGCGDAGAEGAHDLQQGKWRHKASWNASMEQLEQRDATRTSWVGTPSYMAPEIVLCADGKMGSYSFPCDIWSAGCVVWAIMAGEEASPFVLPGNANSSMFERVLCGKLPLERISDYDARDLVEHLLCVRPEARYSATDALSHPWLGVADEEDEPPHLREQSTFGALRAPAAAPARPRRISKELWNVVHAAVGTLATGRSSGRSPTQRFAGSARGPSARGPSVRASARLRDALNFEMRHTRVLHRLTRGRNTAELDAAAAEAPQHVPHPPAHPKPRSGRREN
jgi:serine/threonine protein kinase